MRRTFADELYKHMLTKDKIWLVCLDLGYRVFDKQFEDFPGRCINPGASEQAGIDIAVGLALEDKIVFVYSITSFLLFRPFEQIRLYIDHEKIPVKLIGSGRDDDYKHDGFSHHSFEDKRVMFDIFKNIKPYWPNDKSQIPNLVEEAINNNEPTYINLRR